jgi:hypothetical protein
MTCEKTQTQLNDYVDGTLTVLQREVISKHCEKCKTCAESLEKLRAQIAALRSLPVPPASESFYQNVVANAVERAQQDQSARVKHASFYKFATAAMISALVVWLGFIAVPQTEDRELYLVEVDNEVRTIQVAIESEQTLDSVSMHVELSDNLELSGFGNKKIIKWSTGLREGVNVISLPIVGIAEGRGDITTRVRLNGKEKVMHIKTEYKLPGSVLYENSQVLQS